MYTGSPCSTWPTLLPSSERSGALRSATSEARTSPPTAPLGTDVVMGSGVEVSTSTNRLAM